MKVRYIFIHIYIYIYIYILLRNIYNYILYMTYKSLLGYFSSERTMFTSLPPRRLRWSACAVGRSRPNCVPAPYSGNVTSRTRQNRSQSDAPGPKTDLRIISLRPERPDANGPGLESRAALSTPEASLKRLVPLVSHLAVWEPLPSVSYWVLPEQTLVL